VGSVQLGKKSRDCKLRHRARTLGDLEGPGMTQGAPGSPRGPLVVTAT